jgi:tetraacyldisaccharide 4'-kinase
MAGSAGLRQAWSHRGLLAWLLWPFSCVYGALVALRHLGYRSGLFKSHRVAAKVIVVGNVVAGGAGKTPVVIALVRHLQSQGLAVGVISRGYGRGYGRKHRQTGTQTASDCREVLPHSHVKDVGDEPALIKQACGAPVFVANRRVEAARALLAQYPQTRVIVCDDGLQHDALQRDVEICVFDDRGVGNGFLLPAGPLREPWPRRAFGPNTVADTTAATNANIPQLILHTGSHPAFPGGFHAPRALAHFALRKDGSQIPLADLRHQPLAAVAAIAQPEAFFSMLRSQGLSLAHTEALPDHYDYDSWMRLSDKGLSLVCTEKDAVKLWPLQPDALAVPLVVTLPAPLLAAVHHAISKAG